MKKDVRFIKIIVKMLNLIIASLFKCFSTNLKMVPPNYPVKKFNLVDDIG